MGKFWWKNKNLDDHPFSISKNVSERLKSCVSQRSKCCAENGTVEYLWLYLDSEPGRISTKDDERPQLSVDEWLNVVDEASSLGVRWLILCVGGTLAEHPEAGRICQWAQSIHDMRVGLYFGSAPLGARDQEQLEAYFDPQNTYVLAQSAPQDISAALEELGFVFWETESAVDVSHASCDIPEHMICVGPRGTLYTCGLVLGDERFSLGNVHEQELHQVVGNESLPHVVPGDVRCFEDGCEHCPPLIAQRFAER